MGWRDAAYVKIVTTAIPGSGSSGKSLQQLLVVSTDAKVAGGVATNEYIDGKDLYKIVDWVVLNELPADGTTDRPAFNVSSLAAMTRFLQVASAAAWGPGTLGSAGAGAGGPSATGGGPFFRSADTNAIAAGIMVWIRD